MGAWIEIISMMTDNMTVKSHPSWVRGLKCAEACLYLAALEGRTLHGCVD